MQPGAKFAVLEGDPAKEGPFVMRLCFPDGFKIAPHHPKAERITVISGTSTWAWAKLSTCRRRVRCPGTFGHWSPEMRHFAWSEGETVLQPHGVGPWTFTYVNQADDPRVKKEARIIRVPACRSGRHL